MDADDDVDNEDDDDDDNEDVDSDGDGDMGAGLAAFEAVAVTGRHADSRCLFRYDLRANDLKHRGHAKFLSPEWVCMCARRLDRSANALPQCAQPYGFSPVCERR